MKFLTPLLRGLLVAALVCQTVPLSAGQVSSSSSSSSQEAQPSGSSIAPRRGVEAAGSAVTLETSEPLFTVAAALNSCGYDSGLAQSLAMRGRIRQEIAQQVSTQEGGIPAQRELCRYIDLHRLPGSQNLAQYVSLALFLTPPPDLALSYPESEMPPDALNVVNMLPLLKSFSKAIHLHAIWVEHRADYEAAVAQVHDTVTRMLLETNVYLHQPVSSYEGRRFLVLLEPMLNPEAVNARIYGSDYFVVASLTPAAASPVNTSGAPFPSVAAGLHLAELRHIYLLYQIDPIIYARASSTNRLLPILKTVQDAPIDFVYKNDIVAFTTECLIKAIEARTMDVGFPKPSRKTNGKERLDPAGFNAEMADYDRRAEVVRRNQVVADMRSGWVLTGSFYDKLSLSDREGVSIRENMGELVYGMDVAQETSRAKKVPFFAEGSPEIVGSTVGSTRRGRAPRRTLNAMDQAEMLLQKGDRDGAAVLAEKQLAAHPEDGEALYIMARIHLMQGEPQEAFDGFEKVVASSHDSRTLAWSHIYLGRMYDTLAQPDRPKAMAEYKAALAVPNLQPDVQAAAQAGLKQPFAAPHRPAEQPNEDEDLDPTGKKQKESYSPSEEKPAAAKPQ